jgi:hypothetical protein
VPDADPNQALMAARANLKDTAKWIVTIIGATIVVVIGGGMIAKIADLDWVPRLVAAGSLLVLTVVCLVPLRATIDIVAARLIPFQWIAESEDYEETREIVDGWIGHFPAVIGTVQRLYAEYVLQTANANNAQTQLNALQQAVQTPAVLQQAVDARNALQEANRRLKGLQPRIRDVIELSNTEFLRLKFESLVRASAWNIVLLFIGGAALFVFLISTHRDDQTEKQLSKPVLLQIEWSAGVEAALKKAGMDEKCYAPDRPKLLQLSEKSGLRAGVLAVPRNLGPCPAVRVIVTNAHEVYPDN